MNDIKEPNIVLHNSFFHRWYYGHWREREYLYYDRYGFDHYSLECPVCDNYCERAELGYSCYGRDCNHNKES